MVVAAKKKAAKKKRKAKPRAKKLFTLPHRLVLGVDPGAAFGAALFFDGALIAWWDGKQSTEIVARIMAFVKSKVKEHGCTAVVAVENQFVGRGKAANPITTASILRSRHLWEILAELMEIEVGPSFYPASWQTVLAESPILKSEGDTKDRSMALARKRWHLVLDKKKPAERPDLADALCMCLWYTRKQMEEHPRMQLAS